MTRMTLPTDVRRSGPPTAAERAGTLTLRRRLQLVLAGLWVLDGLLKLQPFMFTKNFAPMTLGDAAEGAPGWLVSAIDWASRLVEQHPVGLILLFALIELAIGFGIAWPRTVKPALLGCVLWVPFLWLFAEGLGGLPSGAGPFDGAPGASVLYAVAAVLLWPTERAGGAEAARFVGVRAARGLWLVLWGALAVLAFLPANTSPDAFSDTISDNVDGAPTWYASLLNHAANSAAGHGRVLGVLLGVALALVALSVFAPRRAVARGGVVLALVLAALIWVFGEGLGMPFMGMGTDPDTGPLLALLALAYWPARRSSDVTAAADEGSTAAEGAAS